MPITLHVPEGKVQALTIKEVVKRFKVFQEQVETWIDWDLVLTYQVNNVNEAGKLKSQTHYIDLLDLEGIEKLSKRFPPDAPWDRILWYRYEQTCYLIAQQEKEQQQPRETELTMAQRPRRPQPPQQQPRRGPMPRDLREVEMDDEELFDELENRQPTRPPRAQPMRQSVQPTGRQPQRREQIEEDDYYAEADAETERDTGRHYPKQQKQSLLNRMRGR